MYLVLASFQHHLDTYRGWIIGKNKLEPREASVGQATVVTMIWLVRMFKR